MATDHIFCQWRTVKSLQTHFSSTSFKIILFAGVFTNVLGLPIFVPAFGNSMCFCFSQSASLTSRRVASMGRKRREGKYRRLDSLYGKGSGCTHLIVGLNATAVTDEGLELHCGSVILA